MIRTLYIVAVCTAILGILFAMPVAPLLTPGQTTALNWLGSIVVFADRFIVVDSLFTAVKFIITVEVVILGFRFSIWGLRLASGH